NQMEENKIPGLTIGFYKDDYTWVNGFGYADLENKVPAKAESAYRLASITKTFTSAAILQLAEKGKINLDAEIQIYVPYYPKQQWPVTVRQLLAHLGGGQEGSMLGPEYVSPRKVVGRISKHPLKFEPGTKYEYTTSGYNLLGAAIEEVSGKSFGDYLRENIFLPLGMIGTRMNPDGVTVAYLNDYAKGWSDSNRTDDAVALLKVAVELHPKSPILYDSLGNLYAQKGQKELAIQAYQKALEDDP